MSIKIEHFVVLGFTVVMEKFDHLCKFNILQIDRIEDYDGDDDDGLEHEYYYNSKHSNQDCTHKIEDAIVFIRGSVQWDECSNWSVENDGCMIHCCSANELLNIGKILEECHNMAMKEMQ